VHILFDNSRSSWICFTAQILILYLRLIVQSIAHLGGEHKILFRQVKSFRSWLWEKLRKQILGRLISTYLHPLLGADEVSWLTQQLIACICDEFENLILSEWLLEGYYDCTYCHVLFQSVGSGDFFAISYLFAFSIVWEFIQCSPSLFLFGV
jgi:hypothetical protein